MLGRRSLLTLTSVAIRGAWIYGRSCGGGVLTSGSIDTGLPAGRHYFDQSDKPNIETAHVHHAM
jgi:hypothetical protein